MKRMIYLFSSLFLLMAGMSACSSTMDEPEQPTTRQDEVPGVEDEENSEARSFFENEFPQEDDKIPNVAFSGFEGSGSVCMVVNSYDEFKSIYQGENALPNIDFSKRSLIIGRAFLNVGYVYKNLDVKENKNNTTITLHFMDPTASTGDGVITMMGYYYYWALHPKFSPKNLVVSIEFDNR